MTARTLAWRTVSSEPARSVLAIAGIAVIGALLFDMLMLSRGLLVSFREMLDTTGYDVRVVASNAFPLNVEIADASAAAAAIAALPEVRAAAVVRSAPAVALVPGRPDTEVALLNVSGERGSSTAWHVIEGTDLDAAGRHGSMPPAVISRALSRALSASPGSTVSLRVLATGATSAVPTVTFTVAGIADVLVEGGGTYALVTTLEAFQHARSSLSADSADSADLILVASKPAVDSGATVTAISARVKGVYAFSNEQLVARFNQNGFAYFRQISFVLSTITLGFAFLLVATLLTVSVNQRLGHVAALRALGIPRARIASALVWESVLLVGVGALLSLPIGWALAIRLDRILRDMPNIPERLHFFILEPVLAVEHLGLLAITGLLATVYPVWLATRLPIAATLRLETVS